MIRIAMCQPALPDYRVPVFNLLAQQPEIELTLFVGESADLAQADPGACHFQVESAPIQPQRVGPITAKHQQAQIDVIDPQRFDMAILPWDAHYRSIGPALKKARSVDMPVVLWGHGYSKNPARWRDAMRNRLGRRAAGVLLYSQTIANRLVQVHGFDPGRVFVAANTVDQRPIQRAMLHWLEHSAELEAFQRRHRLDAQRTIVFVSRLLAENRIDMLLDAMVLLRDSHPDIKLILVGSGDDRPNLETAAQQVGLADRVIFTGAVYDPEQLAPWMLSSAVFCYPINIGLSIFTAFGFGLPVLTSDDTPSHNPEIEALRVDANGLTYRHGDIEDLARQLARILDDPPLRERLSVEAHATATEQYTLENMVQGFLDATRLVDGKSRRVISTDRD